MEKLNYSEVLHKAMASKTSCKYCNFIQGASSSLYDRKIDETENFVVVPTLGSLLPGWQLICPKKHSLNTTMLSEQEKLEFNKLLIERINITTKLYKKQVIVFEHGAVNENSLVGCGVDHAHVHVLPVDFDFLSAVLESEKSFNPLSLDTHITDFYLSREIHDKPYWVCSLDGQNVHFTSEMESTSQFFRKVIAKQLNLENNYDYKKYAYIENVIRTLDDFSNYDRKLVV